MKNSLVMIAFLALVGFSSCKKDWSCLCTNQDGAQKSTLITDETLLDARAKCKAMDYSYPNLGTSQSCSLQ